MAGDSATKSVPNSQQIVAFRCKFNFSYPFITSPTSESAESTLIIDVAARFHTVMAELFGLLRSFFFEIQVVEIRVASLLCQLRNLTNHGSL